MARPTLSISSGLLAAILVFPGVSVAQTPDSIRPDTLGAFPESFVMTELRVLARQRITATGGASGA
ncbi:MAG: hypothetical protein MI725_03185, partial [Pirellulales bacterium]|nr:hypothetical protein [Pirellulales bacterium]